jgi:hypothetical protein
MLSEITQTIFRLFHTLAAVAMLIGVLYLLMAILNGRGVDGYIKGIAIILLAGWMGRLGGTEVSPPPHGRARHTTFVTTAARAVRSPAAPYSRPVDAPALKS